MQVKREFRVLLLQEVSKQGQYVFVSMLASFLLFRPSFAKLLHLECLLSVNDWFWYVKRTQLRLFFTQKYSRKKVLPSMEWPQAVWASDGLLKGKRKEMAGLGPPPMLDCSVPMWWKSICLIMQPSHQDRVLYVLLRPSLCDYRHGFTVYASLCHSSLLATCLQTSEQWKHRIENFKSLEGDSVSWSPRRAPRSPGRALEVTLSLSRGKVCCSALCTVSHAAALQLTGAEEANRARTCENRRNCLKEENSRQSRI